MIIERLVWRAKFGQGDAIVEAFKDFRDRLAPQFGIGDSRILVDVTGPMFTVQVEQGYADLAALAKANAQRDEFYATDEFQKWFGSWQHAVENGTRELYTVVE